MSAETSASRTGTGLTEAQQTRGMRLVYLSQIVGVHLQLFIGASSIGPLFIKKLGGSDLQAMLPASAIGLMMLTQIPISVLVAPARGRRFMQICWVLSALPMLVAGLAALWLGARPLTVWIVLASIFLTQLLLYGGGTFWFPMLHDVIPAQRRGRFFGNLRALWSITYFALSVLAALFLGQAPALWQFVVVLSAVTVLQLMREPCVAKIPVLPKAAGTPNTWREDIRYILNRRDILVFGGYYMLLMFLAGFLTQPLVLYMKDLGFSTRDNTLVYAASVLGSVTALVLVGRMMDRVGTRKVFLWVHIIMSGLALLIALVGVLPAAFAKPCMTALQIVTGAVLSTAALANIAQIFHMAPASAKTMFMSIMAAVSVIGHAFSPFAAGLIMDSALRKFSIHAGPVTLGMYQGMFFAVGVCLILAMVFLPFIQNVRAGCRPDDAD